MANFPSNQRVYAWLGYWRDKMPPEAVSALQDILGPLTYAGETSVPLVDDAELSAITQRDLNWHRLVWKGGDKALEDEYNAAGNDRRALLAEVDRLRHDLARAMANHVADINAPETTAPPDRRDGSFLDSDGCCRVCDGEIPDGHTSNCDIWKLEQEIAKYKAWAASCDPTPPDAKPDAWMSSINPDLVTSDENEVLCWNNPPVPLYRRALKANCQHEGASREAPSKEPM